MALNPIENLVFSLIDLLRGSLIAVIPVFILIVIGQVLRKKIQRETKWSWFVTGFITTFLMMFLIFLFLYFFPFIVANAEQALGEIPSTFAPETSNIIASFAFGVFKAFIVAIVTTIILMPLEFIGLYFHEVVSKKLGKTNSWVKLFVTAYISTVFSAAILIFLLPSLIPGILFFLYFGL
ncbi:MAG TPA: hypothetical protein VFF13_03515 [archaeon]|nr:hypothetical protein [archaeon]